MNLCSAWLAPIKDQLPTDFSGQDAAAFGAALNQEALSRLENFIAGVRTYQTFPVARETAQTMPVVWQKGTTKLLDYAPSSTGSALLVVPSLINRFDILDIDCDRSFLRFLAESGFHPFVVDWGTVGPEEQSFTIADYITERVLPALDFVREKQEGKPVHLAGYCMGGVFAMAAALMQPKAVRSLTLLATPWDFSAGVAGVPGIGTPLGRLFMQQATGMHDYLEKVGILPASFLQSVFALFQPVRILEKFMAFSSVAPETSSARRFVLTEDWLNDGVPLAFSVAQECLHDWYGKNLTAQNKWHVGDFLIDPTKLAMPTFVLAAKKDKIVPLESTLPLSKLIPVVTLHAPEMGHIGLMASDDAPKKVWTPLMVWLRALS